MQLGGIQKGTTSRRHLKPFMTAEQSRSGTVVNRPYLSSRKLFVASGLCSPVHTGCLQRGIVASKTNGGPQCWAWMDLAPLTIMWFLTPLCVSNSAAVLLKGSTVSAVINPTVGICEVGVSNIEERLSLHSFCYFTQHRANGNLLPSSLILFNRLNPCFSEWINIFSTKPS